MVADPIVFGDFESRSPVDLKTAGLARYALHPLTEALCLSFTFDDEPVVRNESLPDKTGRLIPAHSDSMDRLFDHVRRGRIFVAHNAQFELALWNGVMARRFGWPRLDPRQVRCTMAACYAMALPGALENAAHALGIAIAKDMEGRSLMLKMCKPKRVIPDTGAWSPGADEMGVHHEGQIYVYHWSLPLLARLGSYCDVDVAVEREIYKRVLPLSDQEQRLWVVDQAINRRGVPFDMESLQAALDVAGAEKERLNDEMAQATGGAVTACSALPALKEWAADYGVMPDGLAKAEVSELLEYEDLPEPVRAALKVRQAAGRFTSISKLKAIKMREIAARVLFLFQYHAATTGRWAGRGVQPHNFTRDLPEPVDVEEILRLIRAGEIRWLDCAYGEPSIMISKCLRGFIKAALGRQLMGGDFSSIEGRGLAWLAGEDWKLQAYREIDANPDLPDMYERVYAATFNVDPLTVTKLQRQVGKVEDLAFGYQGGVGAFRTMSKAGNILVVKKATPEVLRRAERSGLQVFTETEVDGFKHDWRNASPRTKQYWYDLQDAAINAVLKPGEIMRAGAAGRQVMFRKRGSFLWCRLPSGRTLCYPYPEVHHNEYGPYLTMKSVPDATVWATFVSQKERGEANTTYIVDVPGNSREWCRISTYGGKLAENITQAVCRDILAEAILRVEAAGYEVVLHVHDEVIVEGVFTEADRARFEALMTEVPAWAADFPIKAGCWLAERYRKE